LDRECLLHRLIDKARQLAYSKPVACVDSRQSPLLV